MPDDDDHLEEEDEQQADDHDVLLLRLHPGRSPQEAALLALGFDREDAEELLVKAKEGQCVVCLTGGAEGEEVSTLECAYCQRRVCLDCLDRCELCLQLYCPTCTTTKYHTSSSFIPFLKFAHMSMQS